MATQSNITGLFIDSDARLTFTIGTSITSWSIAFEIYDGAGTTVLAKTTPTSGATITSASSGLVDVYVPVTSLSSLIPRVYQFRLRRTEIGTTAVLAYGNIEFWPPTQGGN